MSIENVITLILAGIGAISGSWAALAQRNKAAADAADIYQRIATEVGERLSLLEDEIAFYRLTLNEWRKGIEQLHCQLDENGLIPIWKPPPISERPPQLKRGRKKS